MTPPDPKPTAPPTVAPASDADIKSWRFHNDPVCDGMMTVGLPAMQTDKRGMLRLIARIEADRAENDRLRARVAELEAALSKLEKGIFDLASGSPICQLHRLKLSGLVDFIRAALKPEPPKEKL